MTLIALKIDIEAHNNEKRGVFLHILLAKGLSNFNSFEENNPKRPG